MNVYTTMALSTRTNTRSAHSPTWTRRLSRAAETGRAVSDTSWSGSRYTTSSSRSRLGHGSDHVDVWRNESIA